MRFGARRVYVVGCWVLAAAILVQFLLAGLGVFVSADLFFWHATVGAAAVALLALLLVLIGWAGRAPGRLLGQTAAILGLVVLQSLLLVPYHMAAPAWLRAVSALHVVNALVIAFAASRLVERAAALWSGREAVPVSS